MNTPQQDLDIIKNYDAKEILLALLKSMDNYHGIPFIRKTREELEKVWNDYLWWPNKIMCSTVTLLFTKRQKHQKRNTSGGSWAPEDVYYVDVFQCNLCGALIEITVPGANEHWQPDLKNPLHKHMTLCTVSKKIEDNCQNISELKSELLRTGG